MRFRDSFAGVRDLGGRLRSFRARESSGAAILPEIRGAGDYVVTVGNPIRPLAIAYRVQLERALDPSQYALVSSLGGEAGILMAADLLPEICPGGEEPCHRPPLEISISPPEGWAIASTERQERGLFTAADAGNAVFAIGKLRERSVPGPPGLRVAIAGNWDFDDEQVFRLAGDVARRQSSIAGEPARGDYLFVLAPFPIPMTGLRSSGIAVGRTALIMLNPDNAPGRSFPHLRRHLPHELFHFYFPNSLEVRENFDWFWEGFTRYIAMLTLLDLKQISPDEFFDSVGGDYESYFFNPLKASLSLVEASEGKFSSVAGSDLVYRKGALVAALYDLELRRRSAGKKNLASVVADLYSSYGGRRMSVGNSEILDKLSAAPGLKQFVEDFISGTRDIPLQEILRPYGLKLEWGPSTRGRPRIARSEKISARERDFLDSQFGR